MSELAVVYSCPEKTWSTSIRPRQTAVHILLLVRLDYREGIRHLRLAMVESVLSGSASQTRSVTYSMFPTQHQSPGLDYEDNIFHQEAQLI